MQLMPQSNQTGGTGIMYRRVLPNHWNENVRYCIEGENGEKFFRDPGYIMQELFRPTESKLFTHRMARPKPAQRKEALIYLSAKEICRQKGCWSPTDSDGILPLKQVQDFMRWLVKKRLSGTDRLRQICFVGSKNFRRPLRRKSICRWRDCTGV